MTVRRPGLAAWAFLSASSSRRNWRQPRRQRHQIGRRRRRRALPRIGEQRRRRDHHQHEQRQHDLARDAGAENFLPDQAGNRLTISKPDGDGVDGDTIGTAGFGDRDIEIVRDRPAAGR